MTKRPIRIQGSIQDLINKKRFGEITEPDSPERPPAPKRSGPSEEEALAEQGYKEPRSEEDEAFLEQYRRKIGLGPDSGPQPRRLAELRRLRPDDLKNRRERPSADADPLPREPERASNGLPRKGDILHLTGAENHVVIFDRDVPSRGYQLVHLLSPDGTLDAQGISLLDAYEFRVIGHLSPEDFEAIRQKMAWNRDLVVFNLDQFQDSRLIPQSDGRPQAKPVEPLQPRAATRSASWPSDDQTSAPPPPPVDEDKIVRVNGIELRPGQWFRVSFGPAKQWEAVLVGRDKQGPIVAHKTGGQWAVMHLDLGRFADSLQAGEMQTAEERRAIVESVRGGKSE